MRSWPFPSIPRLPGRALPPRLYDTATGSVRALEPTGPARMYVCGITPYDATHLGHANTYLAFDTVNRTLRDSGYQVRYTQNVTDVDDPLLERATRDGVDWRDLARRETDLYRGDMTALGIIPPDDLVGAVDSVDLIVDWVVRLRDAGAAYRVDDDVYFSVDSDARFGYESGFDPPTMITLAGERGGDPDRPGKKNPLDPLLWRAERPGEPAWDSPFGPGRPGWHIECAAIAVDRLGMAFDLQGGGRDLVFPHHEMSRAHAETLIGDSPFARHYAHAGMVGYQGEKMSKSLGNLVLVSALRRGGADPAALRLALLDHHYRSDYEWTDDQLGRATDRLGRWRTAFARANGHPGDPVLAEVRDRIADDLDTPGALRAIDAWAERPGDDPDAPRLVRDVAAALLGV